MEKVVKKFPPMGRDLYFMIEDRKAAAGQSTFVTIGVVEPVTVGDRLDIHPFIFEVNEIVGQRPVVNSPEQTFQRCFCAIIQKNDQQGKNKGEAVPKQNIVLQLGDKFEFNSNDTMRNALMLEDRGEKIYCVIVDDERSQGVKVEVEKHLITKKL
jgi:hypothetical protein